MSGARKLTAAKAALFNKYGRGLVQMGEIAAEVEKQEFRMRQTRMWSFGQAALGDVIAGVGAGGAASIAWPAANRMVTIPFVVEEQFTISEARIFNGATVSGNLDVGVYDSAGRRIVSSGGTAQLGVNTAQVVVMPGVRLAPGYYAMALVLDNAVGTVLMRNLVNLSVLSVMGIFATNTSYPLPVASLGNAAWTEYIPLFGFTDLTVR